MDDRAPDPQCPRCRAVSSVRPATATFHEWWCEACNLLFSTTREFAETDEAWAEHARRRWLEAHDTPRPETTELGRQLAARARQIATSRRRPRRPARTERSSTR